jgi:hypothetical protein
MEILVYIIITLIVGICLGNDSIRRKMWDELRTIITQNHSEKVVKGCPLKQVKYKATYKPPAGQPTKEQPKSEPKKSSGTSCSECGNPIELIPKMPGFFYCDKCKKVVNPKKNENARP